MSPPASSPPQHTQVLIIGGGPAGSYAASALAREGLSVTIFEADKFPRYHVGESLLPSVRQYFRFIGAEAALENHGFVPKPGSAIKFNQFKREGCSQPHSVNVVPFSDDNTDTDFIALGCNNNSWNVIRSEFDQLLMNHARTSGASVYELTKATHISFSSMDPTKPISVTWNHTPPPSPPSPPASPSAFKSSFLGRKLSSSAQPVRMTGTTTFDYLIDATGRAGLLSTKYLKNRHYNASLKNIAVWAYWGGTDLYGTSTFRQGAPWFEALTDESGWAWFIPLHDGTTSIGVVVDQRSFDGKLKQALPSSPFTHPSTSNPTSSTFVTRYFSTLSLAPGVVRLITSNGYLIEGSVRSATDFSYSAASYGGSNYRIVGDAGAFIDPFFSSGIHLALTSALSAAATICASIRGHCSELDAADWHTRRVSTSYTRFQIVVLSAYKQIRAQNTDVLCDVDEDNYDRAFAFLRPGASDMGKRLSETELQKSLDFCVNLFNPTSPEQHVRLSKSLSLGQDFLDVTGPLIHPALLEDALRIGVYNSSSSTESDSDSEQTSSDTEGALETKMILDKINARRIVHAEFSANNMESEPLCGYVIRLERGALGLSRAGQGK
ncbi:hypothetical protein H0H87_004135 [Tephrocybe sp. NHM501043]|nr:hypothetical protein H0H87_004135 [Tephrocybe sp. NHM501043]